MSLFLIGLSYRTAPVSLRERIALDEIDLEKFLEAFIGPSTGIDEAIVLSTCNRFEIYLASNGDGVVDLEGDVRTLLATHLHLAPRHLQPYLYTLIDEHCARHLMAVAAGLDSQILGEEQILGQTRAALAKATALGSAGPWLTRLFQQAIHAGKRARSETAISRHATSVSHAAVQLARRHTADLNSAAVLVVGAGDMALLAMKILHRQGVDRLGCINRTLDRAKNIVADVEGRAFGWGQLDDALVWADVVIVATGAPHAVIHREEVAPLLGRRSRRSLLFIDISLPRNVEGSVNELPNVVLYDIDDLQAALDANLAQRQAAIPAVEEILSEEMERLSGWIQGRTLAPAIRAMRGHVEGIAQTELEDAIAALPELSAADRAVLERMMHRVVNKILHGPTVQLKALSTAYPELSAVELAENLFGPQNGEDEASPVLPSTIFNA